MTDPTPVKDNAPIWDALYAGGANMSYPDDLFVRLLHHHLRDETRTVLDFGYGSGATTEHLARRGLQVTGAEIAAAGEATARARLEAAGLEAKFVLLDSEVLPLEDDSFDAVICWQVLTYNDEESIVRQLAELRRVLKPGGFFLASMAAPGDVIDRSSVPLRGEITRQFITTNQKGAIVVIPEKLHLRRWFSDVELKVGSFGNDLSEFGPRSNRYWVFSFSG